MMLLWQFIVGITLCIVIFLWLQERRMLSKFTGMATLPRLPLIGNTHLLMGDGTSFFHLIERITEVSEKAKISRIMFWLGPLPVIVTQEPEDVKAITNTFVEKPYLYSMGKIWLGDGLVTAPGATWKHNIKKLAGTFTSAVVDGYLGVFNAQAHRLVQNLKTEVGKEPFDIIHKYLAYTTLEAICQTALGVPDISESIVTTEYYEAFNRVLELLVARGLNALLHPDFIYKHTSGHREMKKCVAVVHNVSDTILKKRKQERAKIKSDEDRKKVDCDADGPKFKSFLDILLDLGEIDPSLTEAQIKSEMDTVIVGGQETSASTMLFALLMIGSKPRIQDKIYAELKDIFGDSTRPVTKEDLSQMNYLEAVIYETLRMFPPIPGVLRYADRDLQLKSLKIPKGALCAVNVWGAGRSKRVWGMDAAIYRPERWLEDQPAVNPAGFLPFSYGRRACIGKKYATVILKTVLAYCVRELEFVSNAEHMQLKADILLRAASGHLIQVRLRNSKEKTL